MGLRSYYRAPGTERRLRQEREKRKELKQALSRFRRTRDPCHLVEAHSAFVNMEGFLIYNGFIEELLAALGIKGKQLKKEFPEFEFETKLDVQSKGKKVSSSSLLSKPIPSDSGFLSNGRANSRYSENHFYEMPDDSELVIMEKADHTNIKRKGPAQPLHLFLKGGKFVSKKRDQVERNCSREDVHRATSEAISKGGRYVGGLTRDRTRTDFLSARTGRIYLVVCDECSIGEKKGKRVRHQIEIEYSSYIPDFFPEFQKDSERQIGSEILDLTSIVQTNWIGQIGKTKITRLEPTRERKRDFLKCR